MATQISSWWHPQCCSTPKYLDTELNYSPTWNVWPCCTCLHFRHHLKWHRPVTSASDVIIIYPNTVPCIYIYCFRNHPLLLLFSIASPSTIAVTSALYYILFTSHSCTHDLCWYAHLYTICHTYHISPLLSKVYKFMFILYIYIYWYGMSEDRIPPNQTIYCSLSR